MGLEHGFVFECYVASLILALSAKLGSLMAEVFSSVGPVLVVDGYVWCDHQADWAGKSHDEWHRCDD